MNFIPAFIGFIISIGFLALLILFAGYILAPVIVFLFVVALINYARGKPFRDLFNFWRPVSVFRFRQPPQPPRHTPASDKIIDVDYTELN